MALSHSSVARSALPLEVGRSSIKLGDATRDAPARSRVIGLVSGS
jgi:hypothetical protein